MLDHLTARMLVRRLPPSTERIMFPGKPPPPPPDYRWRMCSSPNWPAGEGGGRRTWAGAAPANGRRGGGRARCRRTCWGAQLAGSPGGWSPAAPGPGPRPWSRAAEWWTSSPPGRRPPESRPPGAGSLHPPPRPPPRPPPSPATNRTSSAWGSRAPGGPEGAAPRGGPGRGPRRPQLLRRRRTVLMLYLSRGCSVW